MSIDGLTEYALFSLSISSHVFRCPEVYHAPANILFKWHTHFYYVLNVTLILQCITNRRKENAPTAVRIANGFCFKYQLSLVKIHLKPSINGNKLASNEIYRFVGR